VDVCRFLRRRSTSERRTKTETFFRGVRRNGEKGGRRKE